MRKVHFKTWKKENNKWISTTKNGTFHRWGISLNFKFNPPVEEVIAVVEDFYGNVYEIKPSNIKFKDYDIISNADIMKPIEFDSDNVINDLRIILKMEENNNRYKNENSM